MVVCVPPFGELHRKGSGFLPFMQEYGKESADFARWIKKDGLPTFGVNPLFPPISLPPLPTLTQSYAIGSSLPASGNGLEQEWPLFGMPLKAAPIRNVKIFHNSEDSALKCSSASAADVYRIGARRVQD